MSKIVFALDGSGQPFASVWEDVPWEAIKGQWSALGLKGKPVAKMDAPTGISLEAVMLKILAQAWHTGYDSFHASVREHIPVVELLRRQF